MSRLFSFITFPISVGRDPETVWLYSLNVIYIFLYYGMVWEMYYSYNILPEKELTWICNWVSLFRFPICVGRDPNKSDNNFY